MRSDSTSDVLDANQIQDNLSRNPFTCKYFEGVFPLDRLPTHYMTHRPSLVVCNTAYHKSPGEHWVGFFLNDKDVEFFDSYGCPPSNTYFAKFIEINGGDGTKYNTHCLQGLGATTCGKYVLTYLLCRVMGISLAMYLEEFSGKNPDKVVRHLYSKLFNCSTCSGGQICQAKRI